MHEESKVDETNKCFVRQTQNTDQEDFAIEKFLVYEDFMKSLEVMHIIHSACLLIKDILKVGHLLLSNVSFFTIYFGLGSSDRR